MPLDLSPFAKARANLARAAEPSLAHPEDEALCDSVIQALFRHHRPPLTNITPRYIGEIAAIVCGSTA